MRKFDLSLRSSRSSYFATFRHHLTILSKTDALDEEEWQEALGFMIGYRGTPLTGVATFRRLLHSQRHHAPVVGHRPQDVPDSVIDARRGGRICVGQPIAQRAARHDLRRAHPRKAVL